jgi:hypothetical protein
MLPAANGQVNSAHRGLGAHRIMARGVLVGRAYLCPTAGAFVLPRQGAR